MNLYHVYNRGVEKRDVVKDDDDRMRFVRSLYVFNDTNTALNAISQKMLHEGLQHQRNTLVTIHAWCLMNNHYHLLLSPKNDEVKNISAFMKKLNMGYAKFFNEKYGRSGYLWQGKYKKVLIENDSQLLYIPYYIHLNPVDYIDLQWRKGTVPDEDKCMQQLNTYRWSSFLDYSGTKNFSSLIDQNLLNKIFVSKQHHKKELLGILKGNRERFEKAICLE